MPVGLQIINDYGTILISESNPNYQLLASGTRIADANGVDYITVTGRNPLIALRGVGNYIYMYVHSKTVSGNTHTFRVHTTAGQRTYKYWVFDVPTYIPVSAGLQLFDGFGGLTFDSNQHPAIVATEWFPTLSNSSITLPVHRVHAALVVTPGWGIEWSSDDKSPPMFPGQGPYQWKRRNTMGVIANSPESEANGQRFVYTSHAPEPWEMDVVEMHPINHQVFPEPKIIFVDVTGL